MVDIAVTGAVDLAAYSAQSNTRVRWDGLLELASVNEISNSDFADLDKDGKPHGTLLDHPDDPVGWNVYMQKMTPEPGLETRQTLPNLPMDKDIYTQIGPLIRGASLPDQVDRARIVGPTDLRIEVVSDGPGGFKAGWVALSYGWIVGDTRKAASAHVHTSPYITAPSPRYYLEITVDGDCPIITIPTKAPFGVVGLYLASTAPQPSQNAASLADMWIQRRIDIRQGQQLTYMITGPFSKDERAPVNNKTLVGNFQRYDPDRWYAHAPSGVMYSFSTRLTFRFATVFGFSLPQRRTDEFHSRYIGEHKEIRWRPKNLPPNAVAWQPMFSRGDAYYGLPWLDYPADDDRERYGHIRSNDPAHIGQQVNSVKYADGQDHTGVGNPDTEIETVTKGGKPQMATGTYKVRATFNDRDLRETAPSPPKSATIASLGQTIKVYRPRSGNEIPNAALSTEDRTQATTTDPMDWTITRTNFSSVTVDKGSVAVVESANLTTTETYALSPFKEIAELEPLDRYETIRVGIRMSAYTSGRLSFRVLYYDANKVLISTGAAWGTIGRTAQGASIQYVIGQTVYATRHLARAGAAVAPDEAIPTAARYYRIEARSIGQTAGGGSDGPRNMSYTLTALAAMSGLSVPRRVPADYAETGIVLDAEANEDIYPRGGFALIEVNPASAKRHAALAGLTLNAFIYFGPRGTPVSPEYGLRGLYTPVKPNTTKRYSIYAAYEGVTMPTNALRLVCRDVRGEVVEDYGPLVTNVVGTIAPTRFSKTITIPPKGAWVEIAEGNFSDGFWRVMAPMMKDGAADAAWTAAHSASGTRSFVLDTGAPEVPQGSINDFLSTVQRRSIALTTALDGSEPTDLDFAGTAVGTTFQTSSRRDPYYWSNPQSTLAACPPGRYVLLTLSLSTSDISRTPLVERTGVEIFRPWGVLLRQDGSEFPAGGCRVMNLPVVHGSRKQTEFISDSNVWDQYISGDWLYRMPGVRLHTESREAAEAVVAYRHSKQPFVVEDHRRNRRMVAFAPTIEFDALEDGLTYDALAPEGFWEEQEADGAEFVVMSESKVR